MRTKTIKRTSFCLTAESSRQMDDICKKFGETPTQVITRALDRLHYSLRFPNIPLTSTPKKEIPL